MQTSTELTDYMGFQGLLGDEEKLVRQTARRFVNEQVLPIIDDYAQREAFPEQLIAPMGELGFFGANLPEEYGCAGLSNIAYGLLMYELERGDSGLRSFASVQGALVMYPIFAFGSEAQKDLLAAQAGDGGEDRLLRPDRARLRLQPRRHAYQGGAGGRQVAAQRQQDVDHQRQHRRCRGGLGQDGGGDSRLSGGKRDAGLLRAADEGEVEPAGLGDLGAGAG